MIEIPRAHASTACSCRSRRRAACIVAEWERTAGLAELARDRPRRRRPRVPLRGRVRPHRAARGLRGTHGHALVGLHRHDVVARGAHDAGQPAVARVRAPLPPPARRGRSSSPPSTTSRVDGPSRDRCRSRGARVRAARRRLPPAREARRRASPRAASALEQECVDGFGASPVRSSAPPADVDRGVQPRGDPACRRGRRRLAAAGPGGRRDGRALQHAREAHGTADGPIMIGHVVLGSTSASPLGRTRRHA